MNSHKVRKLENREDRNHYTGIFKDLQAFGSAYKGKRYMKYEKCPYSIRQNFLYKRALFGLELYSKEEVKAMRRAKRKRIERVHERAQKEINLMKQERVIEETNVIFSFFGNSRLANTLIEVFSEPDDSVLNKSALKDLGISKGDVIARLVKAQILPNDFFELE